MFHLFRYGLFLFLCLNAQVSFSSYFPKISCQSVVDDFEKLPFSIQEKVHNCSFQEAIWDLSEQNLESQKLKLIKVLEQKLLTSSHYKTDRDIVLKGATRPVMVHFQEGFSGVFKAKSRHPSSNYKSEVAAYKVDQIFGFNLVPMTVVRKIGRYKGSFQYFIKEAQEVSDDFKKNGTLRAFDYIINNKDRNSHNVLIKDGRQIGIDHGLSIRKYNYLGNFLKFCDGVKGTFHVKRDPVRSPRYHPRKNPELFCPRSDILKRMKVITKETIDNDLKDYLTKQKRKTLHKRIQRLLGFLGDVCSELK